MGALEELFEKVEKRLSHPVRLDDEQLGKISRDLRTLHLRGAGPDQRMTQEDVCLYLDIVPRTLRKRIAEGSVPPPRIEGGTRLWRKRDLTTVER